MSRLLQVLKYLSITEEDDIPWALIRASLSSVAQTAIIPLQDVLRLGNSARMNIPATQVSDTFILKSPISLVYCHKAQIKHFSQMSFLHFIACSFTIQED